MSTRVTSSGYVHVAQELSPRVATPPYPTLAHFTDRMRRLHITRVTHPDEAWWLGQHGLMRGGHVRNVTIKTDGVCQCVTIDKTEFDALIQVTGERTWT